uniref:TRAF-type domain-containing protein n=1 Tax=Macrostomum lignano TaxID=282301 RepID=A0A1I8H4C3_9PLAT
PHLESCDRMHTVCLMRCGAEFEKRFQQKHRDEDCPKRQVICQFCELSMLAETESEHSDACPKFPVPCPNKCSKEVTRETLQEHLDSDCLQQSQPCPFANYGCAHTGKKQELAAHLKENQITHMELLCVAVKRSEEARNEKERLAAELTKKLAGIERRIACLEKLYGPQL